ncbi:PACE efflux transporter [Shimia sp. MMG029]|uniref:PACE efflux transporter n=1 Tax=Shimia sp. MMG029 TaxID=3021978 RepID=UPI003F91FD50
MTLRSPTERVIQTLCFEAGGVALVAPAYAYLTGTSMAGGLATIALLSIVILVWAPVFNTLFDYVERKCVGRLASDRPLGARILHATLHETSSILITCPLLIWTGGYSLTSALFINVSLTIAYVVYTFTFHIFYDRWRPVHPSTDFARDL